MSMFDRTSLLRWERDNLQRWLNAFDASERPRVAIEPSGETMTIARFPLPDGYSPDYLDIALIVRDIPQDPPKGLYLLRRPNNASVIEPLKQRFNVFHGKGFHGAPAIAGFEWLCVGYLHGWHYDTTRPHKGDNIQKMMSEFWRLLSE